MHTAQNAIKKKKAKEIQYKLPDDVERFINMATRFFQRKLNIKPGSDEDRRLRGTIRNKVLKEYEKERRRELEIITGDIFLLFCR